MSRLLMALNWIAYHFAGPDAVSNPDRFWPRVEQWTAERLNRRNWWWSDKGWYQPRSGK